MFIRFPHCTRVFGSMPQDGHEGVGWEPDLTPHNNCLATAVSSVTQSDSGSVSEKWKGTRQRSESEDWDRSKECLSGHIHLLM